LATRRKTFRAWPPSRSEQSFLLANARENQAQEAAPDQETTDEGETTPETEETREEAIDREFADAERKIAANVAAYRKDVDNLKEDGADPKVIEEAQQRLDAVSSLSGMVERLKREQSEIKELGRTNDVKTLAERDRRLRRFERDFAELRLLLSQTDGDGDPEKILARIQRMREEEAETPDTATETETIDPAGGANEINETDAAPDTEAERAPSIRYGKVPRGRVNYGARGSLTQQSLRELRRVVREIREAEAETTTETTPPAEDTGTVTTGEADATPEMGDAATGAQASDIPSETRGAALAAGVDYRNVQPPAKSKTGRVTKRAINKAIRDKGDAEPDEYAAQVQEDLDSIISKIGVFEDDENLVREIIDLSARDPESGVRSNPDDLLALFDDLKRKADAEADNLSVSSRENTQGTTKTYDQKLKDRMRVVRNQNPGLDEDAVRRIAVGELANEEISPDAPGASMRNTAARTDEAAKLTTAGRTNTGRIQSFLRRGTRIGRGSDYTTTSGNQVRPNEFGFEAALIRAEQDGNSNVQEYVLSGKQKVMTREGVKTFKRGDVAYADPVTRRAYDSQELALEVRGEGPSQSRKANTEQEDAGASAQQIRELMEQYRESGDPRGFLDAVAALRRGESVDVKRSNREPVDTIDTEAADPEEIPLTRGDKLLIVRNRNNPQDVRMISPKQADAGGDITKIIGRNGPNSNPANWEARYAPRDTYVANRAARQELFDRLVDADAGPEPQPGSLTEAGNVTGFGRPLNSEELAKVRIQNLNEDQTAAFSAAGVPAGTTADGPSLQDLVTATHTLEISRWSPTREAHQATSKHLRTLYELMEQEAPQGYYLPNEARQASVDQVRQTFEAYTTEELEAATDLIRRLGGDARWPRSIFLHASWGGRTTTNQHRPEPSDAPSAAHFNALPRSRSLGLLQHPDPAGSRRILACR
jgi:hypothetical protein